MTAPEAAKTVVLTCAQPSSNLHIGNYFGAIKNWTTFQDTHECFIGLVDMHTITVPYKPANLRKNTYAFLAQYIACGLDPEKSHLFVQSHIAGLTDLAWILGCLTPLGQIQRMTQFKDKSSKQQSESIGAGLLYYPVLQAADILLYNADVVPVGEDQKQHLELTRDLAQKFNHTYSETFKVPEVNIPKTGARIMSLQSPESKMSKSDANQNGVLYLLDEPSVLKKKIMSAVTDTGHTIASSEDKPGVSNLLSIMSLTTGQTVASLEEEFQGKGYAEFKTAVADAVIALCEPIRKKALELMDEKEYLTSIMKRSAEVAQKRAYKTMSKVYRKVGFVQLPR